MPDLVTNYLSDYRLKHNLTQEELAKVLGVTRQTIIAIEKGNYSPSLLLALKISQYFKKPLEKLFKIKYEK